MRRRLLNVLLGVVSLCAGIGSPIAILLLLLAPHIGWWGATLEKHSWLVVVLVLIFLNHFVVGGYLIMQAVSTSGFFALPKASVVGL